MRSTLVKGYRKASVRGLIGFNPVHGVNLSIFPEEFLKQ